MKPMKLNEKAVHLDDAEEEESLHDFYKKRLPSYYRKKYCVAKNADMS